MKHLPKSFKHYITTKEYAKKIIKHNKAVELAFIEDRLIAKEKAKPKHKRKIEIINFAKVAEIKNKAYRG